MKRAYFVQEIDAEYGLAVVAESSKEAKKIAYGNDWLEDVEWIDMRVKWKKEVDASKFEIGIMDLHLALKLGVYSHVDYSDCPKCKAKDVNLYYDNGFFCSKCEDDEDTSNSKIK